MADLAPALDAFYRGDVAALDGLLASDPELVRARWPSDQGHYCGYFYQATLLHHVAGNPTIQPLPPTTIELARVILDHGAEVDALTHAGPSQPHDIGWTTLGLVATSLDARQTGHQRPLMELLLARGADIDAQNGGPLIGAVYYDELDAAAFLVERGARCDLIAAAGLGRIDRMAAYVADDGTVSDDVYQLVHYSQVRERPTSDEDILGLALIYAAKGGHAGAVAWLLDRGAPVDARPPLDHRATPLHWAALRNQGDVVSLLLARGADRTLRDTSFGGTPRDWAAHDGHTALAARLAP